MRLDLILARGKFSIDIVPPARYRLRSETFNDKTTQPNVETAVCGACQAE